MHPPAIRKQLTIDNYGDTDFSAVFRLLQQLWPGKHLDAGVIQKMLLEASASPARVLLCARVESKVVGFGTMTIKSHLWHGGDIGWVDELVVDAVHRGQGIGRGLLDRLLSIAKERKCQAVELDSAFHRKEAHSFYEALGFKNRAFLFSKKL